MKPTIRWRLLRDIIFLEWRNYWQYRWDFWFNLLGQVVITLIINFFLWKSIFTYLNVSTLYGRNFEEMMYYFLVVPVLHRIIQCSRLGMLSQEIYLGGLNKYLIYPVHFINFTWVRTLSQCLYTLIQLILILMIYHLWNPNQVLPSFTQLIFLTLICTLMNACYFFMNACLELLAFWHDSTWALSVILRQSIGFLSGSLLPLEFFPISIRNSLTYTPFPYILQIPFKILSSDSTLNIFKDIMIPMGIVSVWILFFTTVAHIIWRRGLRIYGGVGI